MFDEPQGPQRNAQATFRLERMLVAARAKIEAGADLSRADIQRLNDALDQWSPPN